MDHRFSLALLAGLSLSACVVEDDPTYDEATSQIIGGTNEPNFRYPWQVHVDNALSCGGVLIDRRWVLTAAHCVSELTTATVTYHRTDPYTGAVHTDESYGQAIPHPNWGIGWDIALIELDQPFTLDRYIQTVALPTTAVPVGMIGTVANPERDNGEPQPGSGNTAIYRAPVVAGICAADNSEFCAQVDGAALCGGDSGSGFVTYVGASFTTNGRATVHGIASEVNHAACDDDDYGQSLRASEVHDSRAWIAQTTGISLASFAGDARAHWNGQPSRGLITVRCESSPFGTTTKTTVAPMNARGAEARLDCPSFNRMRVTCSLGGDTAAKITGFKVTTTNLVSGAVSTQTLAYSPGSATYVSPYDLNGTIVRDVACKVSPVNAL